MSRQVKTIREKNIDIDRIISKVLEALDLEFNEFACKCGILPDSLKKAIKRKSLSADNVRKIRDTFPIRKEFLLKGQEPIIDEKLASVPKQPTLDARMSEIQEKTIKLLEEKIIGLEKELAQYRSGAK